MANYILSDANRFYAATETVYGVPAPVTADNRFAAYRLDCHQSVEGTKRRDKTGARTFQGSAAGATRHSQFAVSAHLVSSGESAKPACGALVQAAMGGMPETVQGLVVATANGNQLQAPGVGGLASGSAVSNGSEIRFVVSIQDSSNFTINAPFSVPPGGGTALGKTVSYGLGTQLPSLSLYDYWDPTSAVSRLVTGAGVDKFQIAVKGDFHELLFSGPAADVLDSCSTQYGVSGIGSFPAEPTLSSFDYSVVSGQLGQVWLGSPLNQIFTLTEASIEINNHLLLRNRELGSAYPMAIIPGPREVVSSFTLFALSDANTQNLYAAAKTRAPISAMLQLGQQKGQMMAIYLPNVIAEMPLTDDSEPYLLWQFKNNLAQGVSNDEAFVAFA